MSNNSRRCFISLRPLLYIPGLSLSILDHVFGIPMLIKGHYISYRIVQSLCKWGYCKDLFVSGKFFVSYMPALWTIQVVYAKMIRVLVAKPELLYCHPNERQSAMFTPADHCDSTPWLENRPNERQFSWSRGWADCPLNAATESCCPRSWKIAGVAGTLLNMRCVDCRRNNITTTFQPHTMTVGWVEHSSSVH